MGRGKSKQKSRYNLRPIPSRATLAQSSPEPDTTLAPEAQQVVSNQSSFSTVVTPPVSPVQGPSQIVTKKGPKEHINENQVIN